MWVGWIFTFFTPTKDTQSFLHEKKGSKSQENSQTGNKVSGWNLDRFGYKQSPDQDVSFILDHHKADSRILVFSHEGMWDEVQEHVR